MSKAVELINAHSNVNASTVTRYNAIWRDFLDDDGVIKLQDTTPYNGLKVTEQPAPDKTVLINIDGLGFGSAVVRKTSPIITSGAFAKVLDIKKDLWKFIINQTYTVTIPDNTSGLDRIDLIIARVYETLPGAAGETAIEFENVTGIPSGSPSPPSKPDDSIILAEISVVNGFTSITNADIDDKREFIKLPAYKLEVDPPKYPSIFYSGVLKATDKISAQELLGLSTNPATMSIDIQEGRAHFGKDLITNPDIYELATATNYTVNPSNPTNPRWTTFYMDSTGAINSIDGTAAVTPQFPSIPSNSLKLFDIFVGASVTSITDNEIYDSRLYIPTPFNVSNYENFVPNSDFEVILSGTPDDGVTDTFEAWDYSQLNSTGYVEQTLLNKYFGTAACRFTMTNATAIGGYQKLTLDLDAIATVIKDNVTHTLSFYLMVATALTNCKFTANLIYDLRGYTYTIPMQSDVYTNSRWLRFETSHHIHRTATNFKIELMLESTASSGVSGSVIVDGVQLEPSSSASEWKVKRVMFDSTGMEEILTNTFSGTTLINLPFTKSSKDKFIRILITANGSAGSAYYNLNANIGGGAITKSWNYFMISTGSPIFGRAEKIEDSVASFFEDKFDISSLPNGSNNILIQSSTNITGEIHVYRNKYYYQ